jgi:hypothetical protein
MNPLWFIHIMGDISILFNAVPVSTSEALTYQLPQQLVDDGTIRM